MLGPDLFFGAEPTHVPRCEQEGRQNALFGIRGLREHPVHLRQVGNRRGG
jgi:hypothetical protein